MQLAAALGALQLLVAGILGWLVKRVGDLAKTQATIAEGFVIHTTWRGEHVRECDRRHADERAERIAQDAEVKTRLEEVDKIRANLFGLSTQITVLQTRFNILTHSPPEGI